MNDTRLGQPATVEANDQERVADALDHKGGEIRILDDLELLLAGGGDQSPSWP